MRNPVLIGIVASVVATSAYIAWRPSGDSGGTGTVVVERAAPAPAARTSTPSPVAARDIEMPAQTAPPATDADQVVAEAEPDDGDNHNHEQVDMRPLEVPPPAREEFGADPASEAAAVAEARGILEGLLEDPDPAVRAEVTALLATIEAAE